MSATPNTPPETRFPVSVVIERKSFPGKAWMTDSWSVIGVVPAARESQQVSRTRIHRADDSEQFLYTGYCVSLYTDDLESYYANLRGDQPGIFVICEQEEGEDELWPLVVTLSYDEMASYVEVETPVFALPIPPDVYAWVEHYVLEHYVPTEKKKRRREKWLEQSWKPLRRPVDS
ncbi:MAG: DUF3305 domain-containing protein [Arenicellales bacterium]|jgi:hypothetical protein|nr:hypothetical protein [Acidiferrobacteraceae bacterium]MDP6141334.1 DUF3305 domain-containing protein [Arenicellales bacterium]MDP7120404.1 DUF3305 domain-containing protein [Arenicellales bacterium]MDP7192922.1 DUF3305 domain-containing protein [Arenicellales bacterium]MDP7490160.1 DUF3305 domain-containing protein [Arenicellales bacterium]|tara:strand:+ start:37 stop:561 length:525 start_codon:yes stop_codon:yes gene_type:complete